MTLSEFILARIAENEDRARHARRIRPDLAQYRVSGPGPTPDTVYVDGEVCLASDVWERYERERPDARVLAECDAKRRIVEEHPKSDAVERTRWAYSMDADGFERYYDPCETCGWDRVPEEWPCPTLRLLAVPYTDHPDYRDEWKP